MNSITQQCNGCLRMFALPMHAETDARMGQSPKEDHYVVRCVCGTENRYPLMAVLPFPQRSEVPSA